MKVIATGSTGLVGSRAAQLLKDKYEFEDFSSSNGLDITKKEIVLDYFKSSDASIVIHLAGKTDVDACEIDKEADLKTLDLPVIQQKLEFENKKTAWALNVYGTENIVEVCAATDKRLIYVSTDFVFDGEKDEKYAEEDSANPINWYGKTKYEGEKIINGSNISATILRIAYPYRASFQKKDLVRVLIEKLKNKENLRMVTDQIITPTFIDDLASVFDYFIQNNQPGVYHSCGSESLSPFDVALRICDVFGFNRELVGEISASEYYKEKARRPSNLALKNDKIKRLGIYMKTFEEGLSKLKQQL